jgi:hypothetical protein
MLVPFYVCADAGGGSLGCGRHMSEAARSSKVVMLNVYGIMRKPVGE